MTVEASRFVSSETELRRIVPEPSPKVRLKILDRLEKHSQHMIELSSLSALAGAAHAELFAGRGAIGVEDEGRRLRITGDLRRVWTPGTPLGGLFMVAGIQETLRVNGRVVASDADVVVEVEEVFLQCPKAFVRSKLWEPATWTGDECTIETSPFALVATEGADGRGDVSPRGDPAGLFVRRLDERTLLLPDRTGNHHVDTLRNVLHRPHATLLFLRPGCPDVLCVGGRARITADAQLLAPSAVKNKAPKLGSVVVVEHEELHEGGLE
jgi:predicted pyridoxine 5'-phosphate oxidase superfamily flavin-nucleotide-binding protein